MATGKACYEECLSSFNHKLDVNYGDDPMALIDFWWTKDAMGPPKSAPIFAYIHGGYWTVRNSSYSEPVY